MNYFDTSIDYFQERIKEENRMKKIMDAAQRMLSRFYKEPSDEMDDDSDLKQEQRDRLEVEAERSREINEL